VGVVAVIFVRPEVHTGGDPQGQMLAELKPVATALPPDAQVLKREEREPVWTTCDGQPRSGGWTWVDVSVNFETSLPPDAVMNAVNRQLSQAGWKGPEPRGTAAAGASWGKRLAGGTTAGTQLYSAGKPGVWWLTATAPPMGTEFLASC
jgi:hypothetical protein